MKLLRTLGIAGPIVVALVPRSASATPIDDVRDGTNIHIDTATIVVDGTPHHAGGITLPKSAGTLDLTISTRALGIDYDATVNLHGVLYDGHLVWTFNQSVPRVDVGAGAHLDHIDGVIATDVRYLPGTARPVCGAGYCDSSTSVRLVAGSWVRIEGANPLDIGRWSKVITGGALDGFAGVLRPQLNAFEIDVPRGFFCASTRGRTYRARVTLSGPSSSAGTWVQIRSSDRRIPNFGLEVPRGESSANISIVVPPDVVGTVLLTASAGGTTTWQHLDIEPGMACIDPDKLRWDVNRDLLDQLPDGPSIVDLTTTDSGLALVRLKDETLVVDPKLGTQRLDDLIGRRVERAAANAFGRIVGVHLGDDGKSHVGFVVPSILDAPKPIERPGFEPYAASSVGAAFGSSAGWAAWDDGKKTRTFPVASAVLLDGGPRGLAVGTRAVSTGGRAFFVSSGSAKDIVPTALDSTAVSINAEGIVVGSFVDSSKHAQPFWFDSVTGNVTALGVPKGLSDARAVGVTDSGLVIVNATGDAGGGVYAVVPGKGFIELRAHVASDDVEIDEALSVTKGGSIVVRGLVDGKPRVFVLSRSEF